jgi:hypothetical protein
MAFHGPLPMAWQTFGARSWRSQLQNFLDGIFRWDLRNFLEGIFFFVPESFLEGIFVIGFA